ncbi:dephospho-CoA kinase [Luteibaculum oceani]|uniref:Dephospho-CoA kinase n=1 Tax=Luteibaculum oceani TaxID=1294296 RepID=A0A5C6V9Y1_9FLAO|nr:dephospho-CoA kinase [Luteibaculum oceani]TXC82017.1 dephospho-CoA kinase [Luteibaculum oceani]
MAKSQILGITGGIGAGKSFVAGIFNHLGIPVYNSDLRAKQILAEHSEVKSELKSFFGSEVFHENGDVDRAKLASIVFTDASKLKQLNEIIHPRVAQDFENWINDHGNSPWIIKEAAILIESGAYKSCDKILMISADTEVRISRVINRDQSQRKDVEERIANQMGDQERRGYCDFEILNDGTKALLPQINEVLKGINWRSNIQD